MSNVEDRMARFTRSNVTRAGIALVVAVGLLSLGSASDAYQGTVWLDESFEDAPTVWTTDWHDAVVSSRNRFSTISEGVDGAALKVSIPAGSHFGSAAHYRFADNGQAEPDELYYRYFLRVPDGFVNYGRGKLPGPAGLYTSSGRNGIKPSDANPGWSARMVFSPTYDGRDASFTQLGFYTYHRDQPGSDGEILMWDPQTGALEHGEWYCVEGHVTMNTPGVTDGVLEGWVDEQLAFYQDDFKFRGTTDPATAVKSMWFDVYYGGDATAPGSISFDFDSLVLSGERIGCGLDSGRFRDTGGSVHADNIERLAEARITLGCNPPTNDRYCPDQPVTRGQMAAFLTRALDLPPDPTDRFTDDNTSIFEAQIQALAQARITLGCNPPTNDRYCPDQPVTRGQMAAFLTRALDLPPDPTDRFTDDNTSIFEAQIQALAQARITLGCNPPTNNRYCPDQSVTRGQMASFLARALSLPPSPDYEPPPPYEPAVPAGYDAVVPAGWSIQAVSDSMPQGARILIKAGTHYRQIVNPKSGQAFVGESGAILNGLDDYQWAFGGSASNVTVENLEILNYGSAVNTTGTGWVVAGNELHDTVHGVVSTRQITIRDNVIHHQSRESIVLDGGSDSTISGNNVSFANQAHESIYDGGIVLHGVVRGEVSDNLVHDIYGFGIRVDQGSRSASIDGNLIENNWGSGVFSDDAYASAISNNILRSNGRNPTLGDFWGAGVITRGPDTVVTGNSISGNNAGILVVEHALVPLNAHVSGNTVSYSGYVGITASTAQVFTSATFEGNDYRYTDPDVRTWRWNVGMRSWDQWQTAGNDLAGTFTTP